jgi:hypothetical protein
MLLPAKLAAQVQQQQHPRLAATHNHCTPSRRYARWRHTETAAVGDMAHCLRWCCYEHTQTFQLDQSTWLFVCPILK